MRRLADHVPDREALAQDLHLPLTRVRDPFGCHESFGHHNNAQLRGFLDQFGFEYDFASSTDYYARGVFDAAANVIITPKCGLGASMPAG